MSRLPYTKLAPEGYAAQSAVEHYLNTATALPAVLLELVRLRSSQMNGCAYCVALHSQELRKHNEPDSRIGSVHDWGTSNAFTVTERAALHWTEALTGLQPGHASDGDYALVREHFNDRDLVDLTLAIASINAFNRLAIAFRPEWHGQSPVDEGAAGKAPFSAEIKDAGTGNAPSAAEQHSAIGDDGGKVSVDE